MIQKTCQFSEWIDDPDLWNKYPQHRWTFNKLALADIMGYACGPSGVPIPKDGLYIVRPTYNPRGNGAGARVNFLQKGYNEIELGFFWCEYFEGVHYSVDYKRIDGHFTQVLNVIGERRSNVLLYKFLSWKKTDHQIPLDWIDVDTFDGVDDINIEYIDDKPIEIHLRHNPDFMDHDYDIIFPVWASNPIELDDSWTFFERKTDVAYANDRRLGFYGKKNKFS